MLGGGFLGLNQHGSWRPKQRGVLLLDWRPHPSAATVACLIVQTDQKSGLITKNGCAFGQKRERRACEWNMLFLQDHVDVQQNPIPLIGTVNC